MRWAILIVLTLNLAACSHEESSVKIFGPGLSRYFDVPTRYFYIVIEENDRNLTMTDFSKGDLKVWVGPIDTSRHRIRAAADVQFHSELSAVVRFRLHETVYDGVSVHITRAHSKTGDEEIPGSPVKIRGPLYHEDCACPFSDPTKWRKALQCPVDRKGDFYSRIFKDLSSFSNGINMTEILQATIEKLGESRYTHSFCHYAIFDNKVYRKCYGEYVGFNMFTDAILLSLTRKVRFPDFEFISNLGDWPLSQTSSKPLLPIISWCGSSSTADIILPTYDLTESSLQMLSRVTLDMISVRANTGPAWEKKEPKAFWRGRDSRQERLDLVRFSKEHPDLLDANLTHVFFFREKLAELEPLASTISFFDFFKYKYQVNIDGTVAAYRLPYLLAGDSVVLKQESTYWEHFYDQLKPWVHYIPINHNLDDLEEKLLWARNHDEEAKQIAKNAQDFAWNNLLPHHVLCYHMVLFEEYAKLLTKPERSVIEDMELVKQPESSNCQCFRDSPTAQKQGHNEL